MFPQQKGKNQEPEHQIYHYGITERILILKLRKQRLFSHNLLFLNLIFTGDKNV